MSYLIHQENDILQALLLGWEAGIPEQPRVSCQLAQKTFELEYLIDIEARTQQRRLRMSCVSIYRDTDVPTTPSRQREKIRRHENDAQYSSLAFISAQLLLRAVEGVKAFAATKDRPEMEKTAAPKSLAKGSWQAESFAYRHFFLDEGRRALVDRIAGVHLHELQLKGLLNEGADRPLRNMCNAPR